MISAETFPYLYVSSPHQGIFARSEACSDGSAYKSYIEVEHATVHKSADSPRWKVIVADDEQMIADTVALILNRSGFEARAVYSGEAAIEVLSSFEPDLFLSDVVMSGMTGVDAAIALLALRPECKILLFSGQAATSDLLQSARERGYHFDLLTKPVHPVELLARLQTKFIG